MSVITGAGATYSIPGAGVAVAEQVAEQVAARGGATYSPTGAGAAQVTVCVLALARHSLCRE